MMAGKVVGLGFEIISKLDSYFLMSVFSGKFFIIPGDSGGFQCKCMQFGRPKSILSVKLKVHTSSHEFEKAVLKKRFLELLPTTAHIRRKIFRSKVLL